MILTMGLAERHRHKRRAMKHCAHEFAAIQQHANYLNLKWLRARRLKYLAARDFSWMVPLAIALGAWMMEETQLPPLAASVTAPKRHA